MRDVRSMCTLFEKWFLFSWLGRYVVFSRFATLCQPLKMPVFIYHFIVLWYVCARVSALVSHSKLKERNLAVKKKSSSCFAYSDYPTSLHASTRFICFQVVRSFLISQVLSLCTMSCIVICALLENFLLYMFRKSFLFFSCIGQFRKGNRNEIRSAKKREQERERVRSFPLIFRRWMRLSEVLLYVLLSKKIDKSSILFVFGTRSANFHSAYSIYINIVNRPTRITRYNHTSNYWPYLEIQST